MTVAPRQIRYRRLGRLRVFVVWTASDTPSTFAIRFGVARIQRRCPCHLLARTSRISMTDIFRRIFELTRAHVGSGSDTPPVGDIPYADASANASSESVPDPDEDDELAGYYANLEIPYGSDLPTVRAAWKRMMKTYHPDLHGDDPQKRQVAGELTAELTRAYQALSAALGDGK